MDGNTPSTPVAPPTSDGFGPLPHGTVLATALAVGVATNVLVQAPGEPGLNLFLFFVFLALGLALVTRRAARPPSPEAWGMVAMGVLVAGTLVLRASPHLQVAAFLAAAAAFALPALRGGAPWMRGSGVSDHLEAVASAAGHAGVGVFRLAAGALASRTAPQGGAEAAGPGRGTAVGLGILLAVPLLLVFGALFMSADRVFAGLVTGLLGTAIDEWASHVAISLVLAWLATGYLTGFLTGTRVRHLAAGVLRRPSLGMVEVGIALGLVAALFALFMAVQFRYLFGGAHLVEVTPGLTYAEYAREGFGQLAFASALVLPTLLVSDWLLERRHPRDHLLFRALGGIQLLLLGMVIGSAFQRVRLYQDAYGLTESRFYGGVFLGWLLFLAAWFAASVLRGRREHFALPALLSGYAVLLALLPANPDARIARTNLERAGVGVEAASGPATEPSPVDAAYLGSLSADAVPVLLQALPRLDPEARCILAGRLLDRWGGTEEADWRNWNLALARARAEVRRAEGVLRGLAAGDPCPDR